MPIHATAIIAPGAKVHADADIGPYCTVGENVSLGAGSRLISHVVIDGHTTIGENNLFHPFCGIGSLPQDLKFGGEAGRLVMGNGNVVREGVTINIGTETGRMETTIGDSCLFMTHSHIAHDCIVGSHVILANGVGIAGHIEIGNHVIFGGLAAAHQFCRIGHNAFVAAGAMVAQDVPPYCLAQGDRARLVGINVIGLKRAGWEREQIHAVRRGFKELFSPGPTRHLALERVEQTLSKEFDAVLEMTDFVRSADRGICPPRIPGVMLDNPVEES